MKNLLNHFAGGSVAAFKIAVLGGPVAIVMTGMGTAVVAMAIHGVGDDHTQGALIVAGAIMIIAGFVEWSLARRLAVHGADEQAERAALGAALLKQGQAHLDRVEIQVQGIAAVFEMTTKKVDKFLEESSKHKNRIDQLETQVTEVAGDVKELKTWRERIGDRLGTLR
jgi:peptidoglycan hydrolase CwlO-like protein